MVVGIVAKNGILMFNTVCDHLSAGESLIEALVSSGQQRLRPVLMTSLAAILGLLPLAIAIGEGAQPIQPPAISVIGGLVLAIGRDAEVVRGHVTTRSAHAAPDAWSGGDR